MKSSLQFKQKFFLMKSPSFATINDGQKGVELGRLMAELKLRKSGAFRPLLVLLRGPKESGKTRYLNDLLQCFDLKHKALNGVILKELWRAADEPCVIVIEFTNKKVKTEEWMDLDRFLFDQVNPTTRAPLRCITVIHAGEGFMVPPEMEKRTLVINLEKKLPA